MFEIKANLFDLDEKDASFSKSMYNGKTIKCLVAPYHTYEMLEKIIPFSKSTFLYPENSMTMGQIQGFVYMLANSNLDDICIITKNQNIIIDMLDTNVRVLTESGLIVPSPIKTFAANIHDIRYELLENKLHQDGKKEESAAHKSITALITEINEYRDKNTTITKEKRDELSFKIKMIGEEMISNRLSDMLSDIKVK